jgi:hypothetical protein
MHATLIDEEVVNDRDVKLYEVSDGEVVDYDMQASAMWGHINFPQFP